MYLAMMYFKLILKGKKEYKDVPTKLKPMVAELLKDEDLGHLIEG